MGNINLNMSLLELQTCTDDDLLIISYELDQEKFTNYRAACLFWACVSEYNARMGKEIKKENVTCVSDIQNEAGKTVFQTGNSYPMVSIDELFLIYTDELVPYLFDPYEKSEKYLYKFFKNH